MNIKQTKQDHKSFPNVITKYCPIYNTLPWDEQWWVKEKIKSIEENILAGKKCFIMVWVKFVNGLLICYLQGRNMDYVRDIFIQYLVT